MPILQIVVPRLVQQEKLAGRKQSETRHLCNVAGDACGGFIVHDGHSLDLLVCVCLQDLLQLLFVSPISPPALDHLHIQALPLQQ